MRRLGGVLAVAASIAVALAFVACKPLNTSEWEQQAAGSDGGPDGPPDVTIGPGSDGMCMMCFDGGFDMFVPPPIDAPPDADIDAPPEGGVDADIDAPPDAAIDAPPDAAIDAPPDAAIDAPPDAAIDAPPDAAIDAPPDAAIDAPPDAAIDAPPDAAIDAPPVDAPPDAAIDAPPTDASMPDASMPDASMPDAGTPDAGVPDAGTSDGGVDAALDAFVLYPDGHGVDETNLVETSFYACSTSDAGATAWWPLLGALAFVLRARGTSPARRRRR